MEKYEDYNPWMNGDASYFDGIYNDGRGTIVEIDTTLSFVDIEIDEERYYLQDDEADEFIKQVAWDWSHIHTDRTEYECVMDYINKNF